MYTTKSIHQQLRDAGVPLDSHASDLYAKVTAVSLAILREYEFKSNVTTFVSSIDGTPWMDIPFANDDFWSARTGDDVPSGVQADAQAVPS